MKFLGSKVGVALFALLSSAAISQAATTQISNNSGDVIPPSDQITNNLENVIARAYGFTSGYTIVDAGAETTAGGTFTVSQGGNSLTFTRVDDVGATAIDGSSVVGDQLFAGNGGAFLFKALVSAHSPMTFGVADSAGSLGSQNDLLVGTGFNPGSGSPSGITSFASPSNPFTFYLKDGTAGTQFFSNNALNAGGLDHMVTFQITGGSAGFSSVLGAFVLGFEDGSLGDADFNDLVVQVSQTTGAVIPTPLPAAAWGGLSMIGGLGGLGILRRRRRVS
jgi:hypothetical protein